MARAALGLAVLIAVLAIAAPLAGAAGSDISLRDVTVSLLEASGKPAATHTVAGPNGGLQLMLDHTRTLKVELRAALKGSDEPDFRPQQVFLRLTAASGDAAFFAAMRAKDGSLYADAKSADVQKQVGLQAGAYAAALLVGDTASAQPVEWALGEVQVLHTPLDDGTQPPARPYRSMDALFVPAPDIMHMHRQPERRAPAVVSLFFTLAVLAPLVAGVGAAVLAGGNLRAFPTGAAFLPAAGFHTGLAAICGLYLLFWLKLNLMQTVPVLMGLGAVTAVLGSATLKGGAAAAAAAKPRKQD